MIRLDRVHSHTLSRARDGGDGGGGRRLQTFNAIPTWRDHKGLKRTASRRRRRTSTTFRERNNEKSLLIARAFRTKVACRVPRNFPPRPPLTLTQRARGRRRSFVRMGDFTGEAAEMRLLPFHVDSTNASICRRRVVVDYCARAHVETAPTFA